MTYVDRYVAFVDILGFGEIVKNSARDYAHTSSDELATVLGKVGNRDPEIDQIFGDDFKFQTFSDSIVMSEKVSHGGLFQIITAIEELAIDFLKVGILVRGGIAKGKLHHQANVMFGPAFLEAYRLESTVANYPRVIISRDVYADMLADEFASDYAMLASDGPPHLHVLRKFRDRSPPAAGIERQFYLKDVKVASACQLRLQTLLNESIHEPRYYEKLRWFCIYWNSTVGFAPDARIARVVFPSAIER